ncbi:MAG: hypothetical protein GDA48_20655 [Hormoscilla sp. GM102CHS1]|nr:hypothetical protein [Hormoscilla sp. GM102CHS1]
MALVGTFSTTDPDTTSFTYELVAGTGDTDNDAFTIVGEELRIRESPDFENQQSYSIRVQTTDVGGLSYLKNFTINIKDVNENPTDLLDQNLQPEIVENIIGVDSDQGFGIATDSNGDVWVTGKFFGSIDIDGDGEIDLTSNINNNSYIVKFNSNGTLFKAFQIGNIVSNHGFGIVTDSNDNAWAIGFFEGNIDIDGDDKIDLTNRSKIDSYVVKFDKDGKLVKALNTMGQIDNNQGRGIATDSNGNVWTTGHFRNSIDIDGDDNIDLTSNGLDDSYVIKFNRDGKFVKALNIGSTDHDYGHDIATDSNGNVWATGEFFGSVDINEDGEIDLTSNGVYDSYVVKFDKDGNFIKALNIGSRGSDWGFGIATDSNDNVWATGSFQESIDIDGDGNNDLTNNGDNDSYVAKFDKDGNFLFAFQIGDRGDDRGYDIATDSDGNVWVTGSFQESIDIDGDGNNDLTSSGGNDSYVAKFNRYGNLLEAFQISSSADDVGRGIAIDSNGNAWATGWFSGNIDIDGDGNNDLTSSGDNYSYLVKFSDDFVTIDENVAANTVVVTLSTADPDTEDTSFTYQLVAGAGDTDNAAFTIDGDELRINRSPDFETQSSYSIRVQTTDAGRLSYSENLNININDVNEKPTNLSLSRGGINFPLQLEVALDFGDNAGNQGYGIATDSNGNVWATGSFDNSIDIDENDNIDLTSSGGNDSYIAKFDNDGNFIKSLNIGDNASDQGYGIATDSNDNVWATGSFEGSIDIDGDGNNDLISNGSQDSYLAKFNSNMELVLALNIGSFEADESYGIATDSDDNVWVTGSFQESIDINGDDNNDLISNGSRDSYVAKFDSNGELVLALDFGNNASDQGYGIATDSNDNVWATGSFEGSIDIDGDGNNDLTSNSSRDSYVAKFNSNGKLVLALNIGSTSDDLGRGIATDSNGNVWATGFFNNSIDIDGDGNYDLTSSGGNDSYVAKFDSNGKLVLALDFGNNASDQGYGIATDSNDNVWATGSFEGSIDIDGDGNYDLTNNGEQDSYIAKFDKDGKLVKALNIGGSISDIGRGIAIDSNDNAWATGSFEGSIDIDGDGKIDLTSNGEQDSYLVKFSDNLVTIDENVAVNTLVGTFSTTDPDTEDTSFTYELVAGIGDTDNDAFTIVGDELRIRESPDLESYSIRVQTTDVGGLSYSENFTINVNEVNEEVLSPMNRMVQSPALYEI